MTHSPSRAVSSIQRLLGYVIFIGALLGLIIIVFVAKFGSLDSTSALTQAEIARNVATGDGLTTDLIRPLAVGLAGDDADRVLFSGPLYPLVLSLPMRAVGPNGKVAGLTSMTCIVLTLILVGIVCVRLFDARVAVGSVGLLALTVPFISQGVIGDERAFLMLIVTAVFCFLLFWRQSPSRRSHWWTVAVALLLGIAWLTRHEMIALVPAVLLFWFIADRRRFWKRLLWTVIPLVVLAAPWSVYSSILLDRPVVSPKSYMLLSDTTLYPKESLARKASPVPEHPWVVVGRHPGMMYLKVRDRLPQVYHRVTLLGNPYVTAFFVVGVVMATVKRRLSEVHWTLLVAIALTAFTITLYTNTVAILSCFVPIITMLAIYTFTDIVSELDEQSSAGHSGRVSRVAITLRRWAGLASGYRGTGRVISFGLLLLALVTAYPMAHYMFVQPPARPGPVAEATALLGEESYDLIMTDVPSAVTWYAGTRTLILPDSQRQMGAIEQAGFRPDAVFLRMRAGLSRDMFPGFEWVERRDLPGLLWVRADDAPAADEGDGDE